MIGFFPDPYPDELFYSACARYADRDNYANKHSAIIKLSGKKGVSAIIDFPTRLNYFVSILPPGNLYSANKIIDNNTLLPFYDPFLPSERAKLIRHEMRNDAGNNTLRARIATTIKQVRMPEYLRFCPVCAEEDRKEFGEAYWHRLHQLPGVIVCSDHFCFLENTSLKWTRGIGNCFYLAEEYIFKKKPRLLKLDNTDHGILIKLAVNARWILSQNIKIENQVIRDRYYNQLLKKELAFYNGKLKHELFKSFQDFYSPSLLEALGCSLETNNRSWIFRIVHKGKTEVLHHPVRHFLMMNFLGYSAEEFFKSFIEFKPFVDAPYPCLNHAADHFGEMKIQRCKVSDYLTKGKNKGKPVAVFSCDCGFIYQRVGPDKSETDRIRYNSVRQHGECWEKKLEKLWNNLLFSRAEIGRQLNISDLSVTYHAKRLNLPMNTLGARVSNDNTHRQKQMKKTFAEHREIYRKKWLEVIQKFPELSRTKLVKKAHHENLWLMRNDTEWIKAHLPPPCKSPARRDILDWKKIDKELSAKVKDACQKIYQSVPPERASITEIIRRVGNQKWIENRDSKLPLTTRTINENLESLEDFMIRKLKYAASLFVKEKKTPTRLQLMVRAVIRNTTTKNSKKIQR